MSERFTLEDLRERLSEKSYKMTPQRREILKIFLDQSDTQHHLSAEEVYDILRDNGFDFGLATVYRSVELLNELELLTKVDFGDGRARYELNTAAPHNHHHLICLNCKKVIEFEEDLLDDLEKRIAKKSGFKIVNHEVKFLGYCSECTSKLQG
mgnify:CR=1 FL=1